MEINNENQKRKETNDYFLLIDVFFVREADKLKKTFLDDCALMLVETVCG